MRTLICELCTRQLDARCRKCQREGNYRGFTPAIEEPRFPGISLSSLTQAELNCLSFYFIQSKGQNGVEDESIR